MSLSSLRGQDAAVATLRRALASRRLHHAYRFEGPDGVGKERAAFALAQALVCTSPAETGEGCGACSACTRAVTFSTSEPRVPLHPDVIVVERGLYPPAVLGRSREETQDISVDQVRKVVLGRLSFPSHEERGRIVIVRRAEELSVSAANALLKTLEEPPTGTHFVLLTSRGSELLDTIRSRALLVRFAPLGDALLAELLAERGITGDRAALAISLAGGSASLALATADEEQEAARAAFVDAVLRAVDAPDATGALDVGQTKEKDRDVLRERLSSLAATLAERARRAAPDDGALAAARFAVVVAAMDELSRNAAPALTLETMVLRMRSATP